MQTASEILPGTRSCDTETSPDSLMRLQGVLSELYQAVRNALQDERESAEECLQRAVAMLEAGAFSASCGDEIVCSHASPGAVIRSGLAPWQVRRVTTYIERNLDSRISNEELAVVAKRSSSYFCRAFKVSFGESPHGYVTRRRMERAQGLMLTTDASLGQIAVHCGLADQSHFSRLFHRLVGESPGAWRRARVSDPAQAKFVHCIDMKEPGDVSSHNSTRIGCDGLTAVRGRFG
jgi:AraC family transcriptional regulator